ncbi:adenosylcobinamide-GDP ribazoletransferase [Halobacillus mangrovi]|uniref:adenosylcobinamide-GDP ribazoletransferase n=1 Tax=Halobacillus mangrovi TaxID=402384 RepID=UPI003D995287
MKPYIQGFILAIQFFSVFPINREIPMRKKHLRGAIFSLPWVGMITGLLPLIFTWLFLNYTPMSMAGAAGIAIVTSILGSGGIHIDGWMDTSDAYFSYQPKEKRLAIMEDPRTGAFGVLSVIVLLFLRFIFIYETLTVSFSTFAFGVLVIPFLSRLLLVFHFSWTPLAKQEGLCYWFASAFSKGVLIASLASFIVLGAAALLIDLDFLYKLTFLFLAAAGIYTMSRSTALRSFGGMTGDVLGATVEGGETFLWIVWWISTLFVTG